MNYWLSPDSVTKGESFVPSLVPIFIRSTHSMRLCSPEALRWAALLQNMLTGIAYCLQSNGVSNRGHNTQSSKVAPLTGDNTWCPWTNPFHPEYLGASSRERIIALTIITLILDKFLRYFHMHHCQLAYSKVCDWLPSWCRASRVWGQGLCLLTCPWDFWTVNSETPGNWQ